MGSSKKHKHDREHKKKKKRHSRSRSRSHERQEKPDRYDEDYYEDSSRSSKRRKYDESRRDDSRQVIESRRGHVEEGELVEESAPASSSGGAGESLSIEETNRLRAKLGLKPLQVNKDESKSKLGSTDGQDVHVPATNIANLKKQQELREKLAVAREKRRLNKKLGKVKALGESDSEEESAAQWVTKNRKVQKEKEMAEKRAKMLEEMDEEFGIGNLVEEAFGKPKDKAYTSKHLSGLKVEHAMESFKEGRTTILTLQDRGVLEEGDDVLVNVNIIDEEKAVKNIENKKKKPDYKPYEDSSVDEYGMLRPTDVLEKYNEEIDGEKKESFTLDAKGKYDAEHERKMQEYKTALQQQSMTLDLPALRPVSEFYTEEEMASFKKVKKKVRKIRKKPKVVTADDLVPFGEGEPGSGDLGSRAARQLGRPIKEEPGEGGASAIPGLDLVSGKDESMEIDDENAVATQDIAGPTEDLTNVKVEVDEASLELELALHKARKVLSKPKRSIVPEKIADQIPVKENDSESDDEEDEAGRRRRNIITLNQTSEFCRSLGEIPTYGQAGNRVEDEDELLDFERELEEERRRVAAAAAAGGEDSGWQAVEIDENPVELEGAEEQAILDDEPVASRGVAAALELAVKKGYIKEEKGKPHGAPKNTTIAALNYSIEDKRYEDLDDKFKNKMQRYGGGMVSDFSELDGYKPDVKITYVDDTGQQLDSKEAFRYLSHRFHGKGSGKSKIEKRSKKQELEQLMKNMGSSDTPLNTASMLEGKLLKERVPYLVLSGSGKPAQTLTK